MTHEALRAKLAPIADWDGEHPDEAGEWMREVAREALALLAAPEGTPGTCATCRYFGPWSQHPTLYGQCACPHAPVQTLTRDKAHSFGCTYHIPTPPAPGADRSTEPGTTAS